MRERLLAAGFAPDDLKLLGPNDRKMNLVAILHGKPGSTLKPILAICHLDVVEANKGDWTPDTPPFVFTEKDGFFYGRGTQDIKEGDAGLVYTLIRMKREGLRARPRPRRRPHRRRRRRQVERRRLAHPQSPRAHARPSSSSIPTQAVSSPSRGKPAVFDVEATEKTYADFHVTATNKGGHSSLPTPDNAIYHVADALARLEAYKFPVELNAVTTAEFQQMSKVLTGEVSADMKAVAANPHDEAAVSRLSANA